MASAAGRARALEQRVVSGPDEDHGAEMAARKLLVTDGRRLPRKRIARVRTDQCPNVPIRSALGPGQQLINLWARSRSCRG